LVIDGEKKRTTLCFVILHYPVDNIFILTDGNY
jgi:hypothetical protein